MPSKCFGSLNDGKRGTSVRLGNLAASESAALTMVKRPAVPGGDLLLSEGRRRMESHTVEK